MRLVPGAARGAGIAGRELAGGVFPVSGAVRGDEERAEVLFRGLSGARVAGENLLEHTSPELAGDFAEAYGAKPATLWAEVQRQLQLRLRSLGLTDTSY